MNTETLYVVLAWRGLWTRPYPHEILGPYATVKEAEKAIEDEVVLNEGEECSLFIGTVVIEKAPLARKRSM